MAAWPSDELESVVECEVCSDANFEEWRTDLEDLAFHVVAGPWRLVRCTSCGAAHLNPRPTESSIGRAYESYFTHDEGLRPHFLIEPRTRAERLKQRLSFSYYNRTAGFHLAPSVPLGWLLVSASRQAKATIEQHIRHLHWPGGRSGLRLLDVGCGSGEFLALAQALGFDAEGLEFDPKAARVATEAGLRVHQSRLADLVPPEIGYDHVMLNHVIEHLHRPLDVARHLWRLLKPGGRLWMQTPNIDSLGSREYQAYWRGLEPPRHVVIYSAEALRTLLMRAGFEDIAFHWPSRQADFFVKHSDALREGRDPYHYVPTTEAQRSKIRRWHRAAIRRLEDAETLTVTARRPGVMGGR